MSSQGAVGQLWPNHDRTISFMIALCVHAACLALGSVVLVRPVEFAVESGVSSMEVNLIAAVQSEQNERPKMEMVIPPDIVQDQMVIPESEPQEVKKIIKSAEIKKEENVREELHTMSSSGALTAVIKPNYLKNPAPAYPEEARRLGQEGLVVLEVNVDRKGFPIHVSVKKSSGYDLLDRAALKAVKRWKFAAAQIGELTIETTVDVPVRFKLES